MNSVSQRPANGSDALKMTGFIIFWGRPGRISSWSSDLTSFVLLHHEESCFYPKCLGIWFFLIEGGTASHTFLVSTFRSDLGQLIPAREPRHSLRERRNDLEQKLVQNKRESRKREGSLCVPSLLHSTMQFYKLLHLRTKPTLPVKRKLIFLKMFHLGLYLFHNYFKKVTEVI